MLKKTIVCTLFILSLSIRAWACGSCTIPRLGKDEASLRATDQNHRFYFEYLFEQKNYDVMDAHAAHELHHDGHHLHDKTTEDLHHLKFGTLIGEKLDVFIEIPYVIRRSLEIDTHSILGSKQSSEGWGDLNLISSYQVWQNGGQSFSPVAGIKFPTGSIKEKNSIGDQFEAELQPGSGSYDYVLGGIYKFDTERLAFVANMSYLFRTEGRNDFEFGDVFVTSFYADYLLNPMMKSFPVRAGVDLVYQNEQKQKEAGVKMADSGGQTILLGPVVKVNAGDHVSLYSTFMYPISQNLGGVHQELDYEWTLGSQVKF